MQNFCFKTFVLISLFVSQFLCIRVQGIPPSSIPNYVPVVLINNCNPTNGGVDSSQMYFLSHGLDNSGIPCYLVPDSSTGICQYFYPSASGAPSSASSEISIKLNQLPQATGISTVIPPGADARLIYLPINSGSRAYISIGSPLYLPTVFNPAPQRQVLDIGDCAPQNINDPNYYTLYQDFEMGLVNYSGSQNTTATLATTYFVNLSYVDYFCLPMQLQVYSYPSCAVNDVQPVSGSQELLSRDQIITSVNNILNNYPTGWKNLSVAFYSDPYVQGSPAGYTRILAAKNSISQATGAQYVAYANPPSFFPANYISNYTTGPQTGLSYIECVAQYCGTTATFLRVFPAGIPDVIVYQMTGSPGSTPPTLNFTGYRNGSLDSTLDTQLPLCSSVTGTASCPLNTLTTELLLSGSLWPFSPAIPVIYTNELSKAVSALFSVGQLPLNISNVGSSLTNPFVVSSYTPSQPGGFYQFSGTSTSSQTYFFQPTVGNFSSGGPWYNVYDLAMHQSLIIPGSASTTPPYDHNYSFGLGYAYDYDDLINLAGLVSAPVQDQYGQTFTDATDPTQNSPFVVVTVSGITSQDVNNLSINNDVFNGALYVIGANNGVEVVMKYYETQSGSLQTLSFAELMTQSTPTAAISVYQDSSHPLTLTFLYGGTKYEYGVNLTRQIVLPLSPDSPYSSIDQAFIEGTYFTVPGKSAPPNPNPNTPYLQIQVNSSPPGWAG